MSVTNHRLHLAKLAKAFYNCFPLRSPKCETMKAERAQRKSQAKRRILKGSKYTIAKGQKYRANKVTDKIKVNIGLRSLSKEQRKQLFINKYKQATL